MTLEQTAAAKLAKPEARKIIIRPYVPETNRTRESGRIEWANKDDAPPLGFQRIFVQVMHDLFGTKDIQDAATATHSWMAGAVGHATLGQVPTLVLCFLCLNGLHLPVGHWGYVASGLVVFGYFFFKEWQDYADTHARTGNIFQFNSDEVKWNIFTALFYIGLGALMVVLLFLVGWWRLAFFLLLWPAFRIALWWLRRKLAFQQADLPYQYRLATFNGRLDADSKVEEDKAKAILNLANAVVKSTPLLKFLFCHDLPHTDPAEKRHLIIYGPLNSGKTSLAVGIGTEFAFSLNINRYLSAIKLVQSLAEAKAVEQPEPNIEVMTMEFDGGRNLWPLRACDLLIIDDVAQFISPAAGASQSAEWDDWNKALKEFEDALGGRLTWLGPRRSVWVLEGPEKNPKNGPERISVCKEALIRILKVTENEIMTVQLEGPPPIPDKFKPLVDKFDKAVKGRAAKEKVQSAKKPVVAEAAGS